MTRRHSVAEESSAPPHVAVEVRSVELSDRSGEAITVAIYPKAPQKDTKSDAEKQAATKEFFDGMPEERANVLARLSSRPKIRRRKPGGRRRIYY